MSFHKYADDLELVADYLTEVSTDNADQMNIVARRNEAVSAMIDSYCNRRKAFFVAAGNTATPRHFRGTNSRFLILPVHVLGAVQVSGVSPSLYYENTENGWLYGNPETAGDCANFWLRNKTYVVTARWGYEETPAEIIEATKIIVAHFYDNGQGILGDITPNGFVIQRDMPPTAKTLLQPFIKKEFELD